MERKQGMSKEAERSIIAASAMFPGFRFSPTDEELILYYLQKKLDGFEKCVEVIPELDICKFEPWDLPSKAIIKSNEEWFFFSPRGKKYPNGSQSKRATEIGYWKATGKERSVKSGSNVIGTKRTLVFHIGRAPKGERTEWIMHEYCLSGKAQAKLARITPTLDKLPKIARIFRAVKITTNNRACKDALVVCRLRRKSDNQGMDDQNGEIQSLPSNPSLTMESSGNHSGCGNSNFIENITNKPGNSKDKVGECSVKKSSSSNESHSVEQKDCTSQSGCITKDEIVLQPKYNGVEDDLFADILNDNIIQLDECSHPTSTYGTQNMVTCSNETVAVVPRTYNPSHQPSDVPQVQHHPPQGTANRRIRLPKLCKDGLEEELDQSKVSSKLKHSPRCYQKYACLYVILVFMALVILLMVCIYNVVPAVISNV